MRHSHRNDDFSILSILLACALVLLSVLFLVLEWHMVLSSISWGTDLMNALSNNAKWFVLTQLVWNNCLMTLNTNSLWALLTFVPLLIIYGILQVLAVALELLLSAGYLVIMFVLPLLVGLFSIVLCLLPALFAVASVILTVRAYHDELSLTNKIMSSILLPINLTLCAYYFVILFSHASF